MKHRSFFCLSLGLIFLGCIPHTIISGGDNSLLAAIIYLFFGIMCLWFFADFSTLEISNSNICYKRNLLLYQQKILKERSRLISVTLEVSPRSRSNSKRIKFSFADDTFITIPKAFVGSTIGWTIDKVYESIRDILPELKQDSSDEILSLLSQGHKIQAINLVRKQYGMNLVEAKDFVEDLRGLKSNGTKSYSTDSFWFTEDCFILKVSA